MHLLFNPLSDFEHYPVTADVTLTRFARLLQVFLLSPADRTVRYRFCAVDLEGLAGNLDFVHTKKSHKTQSVTWLRTLEREERKTDQGHYELLI